MNYSEIIDILKSGKPIQFFDFALSVEDNTRKLYLRLSEKAENPEIREFFSNMAEVERAHYNLIAERYMSTFDGIGGVFDSPPTLDVDEPVELDMENGDAFPKDILDALNLAFRGEQLAYTFYKTAEESTEDTGAKAVLRELRIAEEGHVERVRDLIAKHKTE
jgi:rubrerythrin